LLLGCGTVNPIGKKGISVNVADWEVTKFAHLQGIIIPYLIDELKSSKSEDFKLF
jgi:phosphoribulokinase